MDFIKLDVNILKIVLGRIKFRFYSPNALLQADIAEIVFLVKTKIKSMQNKNC